MFPAGAQHGGRVHDRGWHAADHRLGARHRGGRHGARHPRRLPRVPGVTIHHMSRVTCHNLAVSQHVTCKVSRVKCVRCRTNQTRTSV